MKFSPVSSVILHGLSVAIIGYGGYVLYSNQHELQKKIEAIDTINLNNQIDIDGLRPATIKETVVSTSALWRPIQQQAKDTVVQVFSQIAEFDMLQPYKSPSQYSACGSGFFINSDGDLITNAHVVNESKAVWIQIPSLGRTIIDVDVVGISPERDLALLRVREKDCALIKKTLGEIPFLQLGDSDLVRRSDEVMALGYPLGQQSLKSTTGVISGMEQNYIQISAAINPGNSGGPLINNRGEVIGINSAGITEAQNVGYAIPISELKVVLSDLYKVKVLRKPFLGVLYNNSTDTMAQYLGNPQPGGCYVVEVVPNSTLYNAGIKRGDMVYEINGYRIDPYGEMTVPWSEDKIAVTNYVSRLSVGQDIHIVAYRNGKRLEMTEKFNLAALPRIRMVYPAYEDVDYEVFGGMVVMELTMNHVKMLAGKLPGLAKYAEMQKQHESALIITHIFPDSQLTRSRTLTPGATINEVNGVKVSTLQEYREQIRKSRDTNFLALRATDNITKASDNVFVVLPFNEIIEEESRLAHAFKYPMSQLGTQLVQSYQASKALKQEKIVA